MIRWIRSSGRRGRAVWLALALLCLTIQPAMLFACDLHDLAHAMTAQSAADVHAAHADAQATPTERGDGGSLLHDVLHAAHCCVHAPVLPSAALVAFAFDTDVLVAAHAPPPAPEVHPSNLLRPPIAA